MLELSGVTVTRGTRRILDAVSLRVNAGEIVALSGEPGAGKTAIVRCVAGDMAPSAGQIRIDGVPLAGGIRGAAAAGVGVVWNDIVLCENLDVAENLMLGRERRGQLLSDARLHSEAAQELRRLGIPIRDTSIRASHLSDGHRRLLGTAMALSVSPRVLVLDEPTLNLDAAASGVVERLLAQGRADGVAVLLISRDLGEMFRIADRIAVLRHGQLITEIDPRASHPDEVAALLAGGRIGGSARRQLKLVHGLADRLARTDPSSGLALIVSALATALSVDRDRITVLEPDALPTIAGLRLNGRLIVRDDAWLMPVLGEGITAAVIEVQRDSPAPPSADEAELLALYAGYAASALERRKSEVAQREAAVLRHSRQLQRQFLLRLGHELRTPLTAIRGYATSLDDPNVQWGEEVEQRFVARISAESARLGRLVDDLLDFSAIESGVMRLQPGWCELRPVVDAAVACLPDDWARRVAVSGELPAIWADHDRLEQVFVNLIGNGLRHNSDQTRVTVTLRVASSDRIEIVVADDGAGLPAALRAAPFEQPPGPRARTSGAGLGLPIARGVIEAHGGTIELLPGELGTSFLISLPVEQAPQAGLSEPAAASEPALSGAVGDA